MDDDIAYYRILEFILVTSSFVQGVHAQDCLDGEELVGGVCECVADCSTSPFHNTEIYACCAAIIVLLVLNIVSSVFYMREATRELSKLTASSSAKERVSLIFSRLHPPGI